MAESFDARVKLVCLVAYIVAALHARTPVALGVCAAAAVAMVVAVRLKPHAIAGALRSLAAILAFTALMQFLYSPAGALEATATMLVGLACVMVASIAFMRCTPSDQLVATFDWLCAPLRAIGLRTGTFMLALTVAFRFVPVLASEFGQLKQAQLARHASFEGSVRDRVSAYARLFPPLVRSSFRRADRLADTFVARCFTGAGRASLHPQRFRSRDLALAAATAAFLVVAFVL
ncbi:MAG: energy-coupling factor transporter transmembrane protein EcfT [Eggerthellaceae bacterium]|nr:energy-coupling factor transporter transmembrane protein EcfT [Eggerthellaceae bacterium]